VIATEQNRSEPSVVKTYTEAEMRQVISRLEGPPRWPPVQYTRAPPPKVTEAFAAYFRRYERRRRVLRVARLGLVVLAVGGGIVLLS
jgi:hypothetical protein